MKLPMTSDEYEGEFIIHSTTFEQGKRIEEREWIPRTIHNNSHTGNAVIIGNGKTRELVDTHLLKTHMGGMKGERRAQLYGCNALYRDMAPDFLISTNPNMVEEIVESGYTDKNIVYTNAREAVKHPGKFHLIPQNMPYNAGCIATYIACFDKHEHIYLLGFDGQRSAGLNINVYAGTKNYNPENEEVKDVKWLRNMERLFSAYNEVDFIWVHPNPEYNFPEQWRWHKNVRFITTKKFMGELSIGIMRNDV